MCSSLGWNIVVGGGGGGGGSRQCVPFLLIWLFQEGSSSYSGYGSLYVWGKWFGRGTMVGVELTTW